MAQASTSRLGICQTCNTTPARYSCPACSFPSCSLPCSTSHKTAKNCSGIAPPVWSKPIQANEMNWGSLMRDQSYIAGVGRAVEDVGRQLVGDKLIPQGRRLGADETVRLDERSDKEDKMVREARNQGVELMLLPKGMSKRQKNATRWDPKNKQLEWTVEVTFQPRPTAPSQPPSLITTIPLPSSNTLQSVLLSAIAFRDKKGKGKAVDPEEATWRLTEKEWLESFKSAKVEETKEEEVTEEQGEQVAEEPETEQPKAEEDGTGEADRTGKLETEDDAAVPDTGGDDLKEDEPRGEAESAPTTSPEPAPSRLAPPAEDSPFVLLLAFHSRPIYADHSPSDGTQSDRPTPTSSKPPARPFYQIQLSPSLTLRDAISGSCLLETPSFELWPRESFLRQKLLGKIKIVEQPNQLPVRERTGVWERGRGRGRGGNRGGNDRGHTSRGRGRGRGGGGGSGGNYEGSQSSQRWEGSQDNRSQDSGWGKRGGGTDLQGGDAKRSRMGE